MSGAVCLGGNVPPGVRDRPVARSEGPGLLIPDTARASWEFSLLLCQQPSGEMPSEGLLWDEFGGHDASCVQRVRGKGTAACAETRMWGLHFQLL